VNAVASAIIVIFMAVSFALDKEATRRPLGLSVQFFFGAMGAGVHISQSLASVFHH
jgi:hypothetical protein